MRFCLAVAALLLLTTCGSAPSPPPRDASLPSWYASSLDQLTALNRLAEDSFKKGHSDQAAAAIKEAQSLSARVLSVPRPSLAAVEAAADVDDLYGRMLLANRNYGWAQMFFQKNRSRWKNWKPQTPETERRFKQAESEIAECDKHIN
jgi:hypothetical protein